jgi:hypothetical protein
MNKTYVGKRPGSQILIVMVDDRFLRTQYNELLEDENFPVIYDCGKSVVTPAHRRLALDLLMDHSLDLATALCLAEDFAHKFVAEKLDHVPWSITSEEITEALLHCHPGKPLRLKPREETLPRQITNPVVPYNGNNSRGQFLGARSTSG